ncbi:MAG TPA: ABC transporter permease [Bryobacteraceae bacterium]|nr:ABC transporter permease [Bryobacteraceae bacterium]
MFLFHDLQFGWRSLTRTPGFFIVAVLSLVLGIGANTAIFSLLDTVLMKALPVKNPQQLVIMTDPNSSGVSIGSDSGERTLLSYPEFEDLKQMTSVSALFATQSALQRYQVSVEGGSSEEAYVRLVSGDFFSALGIQPHVGRFFDESVDKQLGRVPYAVLSDNFWARRFGRSDDVLGKTITVRQAVLTVIGIAPPGFFGESVGSNPDLWVPLSMQKQVLPGRDWLHPLPDPTQKVMWLHVFGRLQPGYSLAQAQTEANGIFKRGLEASYASLSADAQKSFMDQRLKLRPAAQGASELRDRVQKPLQVIFAAVGTVLLICCVNVTNLLLARANTRRREVMIRLALGANKYRVVRQLLTESLILSVLGACGGLLLAQTGAALLMRLASTPNNPIQLEVGTDWRVLLFTAGIAVATTVVFGLAPALRAARTEIGGALREGGRGMTASAGRILLSKAFVVAQVALSLVLVIGAGLFLRTLANLQQADLGYPRERLLTMRVDGVTAGYKGPQLIYLYKRLREALASSPGVKALAFSENGLFGGTESGDQIEVEGYTPHGKDDRGSRWDQVGPNYFSTLGIPILLGRGITERDQAGGMLVCVINQAFAKLFFADRNPIGKHIVDVYGDTRTVFEIVGVAKDSRDHSLRGVIPPRFFVAVLQKPFEVPPSLYFEVRTAGDPNAQLVSLRRVVQSVDPHLAILAARSLGDLIDDRVRQDRLIARMTSIFGGLALLLAAIGIYGVLAYGVSQRTSEIGIRMAVGAESRTVIKMILQETSIMLFAGLATGLIVSGLVNRLIKSQLVGLEAMDPLVLGVAVAIMVVLGVIAAYGPAWRASRVDPVTALRNE